MYIPLFCMFHALPVIDDRDAAFAPPTNSTRQQNNKSYRWGRRERGELTGELAVLGSKLDSQLPAQLAESSFVVARARCEPRFHHTGII